MDNNPESLQDSEGGIVIEVTVDDESSDLDAPSKGVKRKVDEEGLTGLSALDLADAVAKKKRLCRYPGCNKVIKSQGHCQRHGAKAKRCKVEGCDKQAQGTHDGMCKRHWKAANFPDDATKKGATPPEPEGDSVYDFILPMSIAYRPVQQKLVEDDTNSSKLDFLDPPAAPDGFQVMPLVSHLKEGTLAGKPAGWHRNAERRARGMFPVKGLSVQLEPWERQLALVEILLLTGGTPYANFKELAHAWGREKGFHHVLANSVCERRGEVERKKRSDAGKSMTDEERQSFRSKLQKARDKNGTSKRAKREASSDDQTNSKVSIPVGDSPATNPGHAVDKATTETRPSVFDPNDGASVRGGEAPGHVMGNAGETRPPGIGAPGVIAGSTTGDAAAVGTSSEYSQAGVAAGNDDATTNMQELPGKVAQGEVSHCAGENAETGSLDAGVEKSAAEAMDPAAIAVDVVLV